MKLLTATRLSDNEVAFDNDVAVTFWFDGKNFPLQPGQTIWFADKLQYSLRLLPDSVHSPQVYTFIVPGRAPAPEGVDVVVIDFQEQIAKAKAEHCARIDAEAETVRGQFITLGSGQSMVYMEKRKEAEAFTADPEIDTDEIPHLAMEAAALGVTIPDVVADVLTQAHMWSQLSAMIEAKRLGSKKAVKDAVDLEDVDLAASVDWSLPTP